jgi:hypothetical protein
MDLEFLVVPKSTIRVYRFPSIALLLSINSHRQRKSISRTRKIPSQYTARKPVRTYLPSLFLPLSQGLSTSKASTSMPFGQSEPHFGHSRSSREKSRRGTGTVEVEESGSSVSLFLSLIQGILQRKWRDEGQ